MELVSFELAKKLKAKGYSQNFSKRKSIKAPSYHYYNSDGILDGPVDNDGLAVYVSAPLISQVLKWLRGEKKLHVVIELSDKNTYCWYIQMVDIRISKYSSHLNNYFDNWEETAFAAIEYTLDNLI